LGPHRIDFATNIDSNSDPNQPSEFKLLVEERRIIESVAGNEHLEIQWRLATLSEVKVVAAQYQKYLQKTRSSEMYSSPKFFLLNLNTRVPGGLSDDRLTGMNESGGRVVWPAARAWRQHGLDILACYHFATSTGQLLTSR
jgi:hypothetical protein